DVKYVDRRPLQTLDNFDKSMGRGQRLSAEEEAMIELPGEVPEWSIDKAADIAGPPRSDPDDFFASDPERKFEAAGPSHTGNPYYVDIPTRDFHYVYERQTDAQAIKILRRIDGKLRADLD